MRALTGLPCGKNSRNPSDKMLDRPQSTSGRDSAEKNPSLCWEFDTCQPVPTLLLYWLTQRICEARLWTEGSEYCFSNIRVTPRPLYPVRSRIRDEAFILKTEDVIMCCLIRVIARHRGQWWVRNNGGMTISKGKRKTCDDNPLQGQLVRDWTRISTVRS
jgi:hypothetical protein